MSPEEHRRLHTSVLSGSGNTPRKARKARAKAAAQRRTQDTAARKAARFIRFWDAFNLPLVIVVDSPGFNRGVDGER